MDDHKPLAKGTSGPAPPTLLLDEVPELPSDAASVERYRKAADEGDAIAQVTC